MSNIDLTELTVEKLQAGFASGAFTSESLIQAYLDRIAEWNPSYNAIVLFNESALADARAIDARRASPRAVGSHLGNRNVIPARRPQPSGSTSSGDTA